MQFRNCRFSTFLAIHFLELVYGRHAQQLDLILKSLLNCAGKDCEYFGEEYEECRDDLAMDGILRSGLNSRGETTYKYRLTDKPCSKCPIRGTSSDSFQVWLNGWDLIKHVE